LWKYQHDNPSPYITVIGIIKNMAATEYQDNKIKEIPVMGGPE
jgi:hypothetical protein